MPDCIRLEVGQPDFLTPQHICQAAQRAISEGWHGYTQMKGLPALLDRLAAKLRGVNGIDATPERVMVGNGGAGVMSAALFTLCDPGDEVLVPDPHWPNYLSMLTLAQARPVLYPCPRPLGYLPDLDQIAALITPRTRALIVNSPHNPSGAVYPAETLRALGELATRHNFWLIGDECYDQIVLDPPAPAPALAVHADPDRVISAFSFSKSFAMTGWRVGYGTGPVAAVTAMTKAIEATTSCVNTIGQKAAEAALDGPQDCIGDMVAAYRRRRELLSEMLQPLGLLPVLPHGAFYALVDISPSGLDSGAFAARLLEERRVSAAPGRAFGPSGEGTVRISLSTADDQLREGVSRLRDLIEALA
jgi:aspartate aminotransferase